MSALSFADAAERIKSGLDIVDVIQRHVILKKTGRSYTGKCPFHNDKSPSMNVSREKGIFKCFSCGVGGDALTFLMRLENRTFGEVIRELAQEQGLEIQSDWGRDPEVAAAQKDGRQKILALNDASCDWFQKQIHHADAGEMRQYFQRRYPDETDRQKVIHSFQLGYALPGWENLTSFLKEKFDFVQANPDLLINAGLSNVRDHGQGHYDRFRNRLMIPIQDEKGQVVAFGGRALSDEDKPKYLNSPETAVYKKNQILYGFYQARDTIRASKAAVVMEGYFDVISAHLAGVMEAVGSCGTAMTENHLKLLTRFGAEMIYLAFDSDEAGVKAALSAITLIEPYLENSDLDIRVLVVPDGKDPDDYIRSHGGSAFRELMASSRHYLAFKCDMAIRDLALQTPEGRIQAANRLTPLLAAIVRPSIRAEYLKRYAERLGMAEETLHLELRRFEQNHSPAARPRWDASQNFADKKAISKQGASSFKRQQSFFTENLTALRVNLPSRQIEGERILLKLAVYNSESFSVMMGLLDATSRLLFSDPLHQEIWDGLCSIGGHGLLEAPTSPENPAGTLIEKMNHLYFDKPDTLHRFVDLVMTAESFGESLGLGELQGSFLKEKVTTLVAQQLTQLAHCRKKEQLQSIKSFASRNEGDAIALTYEFKDRMAELLPPNEASTSV